MANRTFHHIQAFNRGLVIIAGSFRPNGSSAVDNDDNTGKGWSVVRDAVGDFTITLEDKYTELLSGHLTVAHNADTDVVPQWAAIDVVTAKTLKLRILAAATPTDIASNADNRVHFTLILRNTSVNP